MDIPLPIQIGIMINGAMVVILAALVLHLRERGRADRAEMNRWRWAAGQADRWLAEFPDAIAALEYVRSTARGDAVVLDIARVRVEMRQRRNRVQSGLMADHVYIGRPATPVPAHTTGPLTARAAAARESDFRVDYQHLGASECGGDE